MGKSNSQSVNLLRSIAGAAPVVPRNPPSTQEYIRLLLEAAKKGVIRPGMSQSQWQQFHYQLWNYGTYSGVGPGQPPIEVQLPTVTQRGPGGRFERVPLDQARKEALVNPATRRGAGGRFQPTPLRSIDSPVGGRAIEYPGSPREPLFKLVVAALYNLYHGRTETIKLLGRNTVRIGVASELVDLAKGAYREARAKIRAGNADDVSTAESQVNQAMRPRTPGRPVAVMEAIDGI